MVLAAAEEQSMVTPRNREFSFSPWCSMYASHCCPGSPHRPDERHIFRAGIGRLDHQQVLPRPRRARPPPVPVPPAGCGGRTSSGSWSRAARSQQRRPARQHEVHHPVGLLGIPGQRPRHADHRRVGLGQQCRASSGRRAARSRTLSATAMAGIVKPRSAEARPRPSLEARNPNSEIRNSK